MTQIPGLLGHSCVFLPVRCLFRALTHLQGVSSAEAAPEPGGVGACSLPVPWCCREKRALHCWVAGPGGNPPGLLSRAGAVVCRGTCGMQSDLHSCWEEAEGLSIWPNMGCSASLFWPQMLTFLIRNVSLKLSCRAVASQV